MLLVGCDLDEIRVGNLSSSHIRSVPDFMRHRNPVKYAARVTLASLPAFLRSRASRILIKYASTHVRTLSAPWCLLQALIPCESANDGKSGPRTGRTGTNKGNPTATPRYAMSASSESRDKARHFRP